MTPLHNTDGEGGLDRPSAKQTLYPANSIPTAQELVGLIESFIEGKIEQKFAYQDQADMLRLPRCEEQLGVLRVELIHKLTEGTDLLTDGRGTTADVADAPEAATRKVR